jgi:hypothetical protein
VLQDFTGGVFRNKYISSGYNSIKDSLEKLSPNPNPVFISLKLL